MYPSGSYIQSQHLGQPERIIFVTPCLSPEYCCTLEGLAKCTRWPSSIRRSTSQYQLYVDSTTIPKISSLNGLSVTQIRPGSFRSFFFHIRLPSSSMIPTYVLLECRSKPLYNPIRHLLKDKIGFLSSSIPQTDMLGRCPLYDYQTDRYRESKLLSIYDGNRHNK